MFSVVERGSVMVERGQVKKGDVSQRHVKVM